MQNLCKGLIKPFVLRCFRCRCGFCKVPAVVVYRKSQCRHSNACSVCICSSKSLKNPKRTKLCGFSFSILERSLPYAHGNLRKFTPESLVEWQAHISCGSTRAFAHGKVGLCPREVCVLCVISVPTVKRPMGNHYGHIKKNKRITHDVSRTKS